MSCYDGFKISRQLKRLFTEQKQTPQQARRRLEHKRIYIELSCWFLFDTVDNLTVKPAAC